MRILNNIWQYFFGNLSETRQPLLINDHQPSFENKINRQIREQKNLLVPVSSDLNKNDQIYFRKKTLLVGALLLIYGGAAGAFYQVVKKYKLTTAEGNRLLDTWSEPINSTSSNISCTELYPSPPAGCDRDNFSPVGIDTNSSCLLILSNICQACFATKHWSHSSLINIMRPMVAASVAPVPNECSKLNNVNTTFIMLSSLSLSFFVPGITVMFYKAFRKLYAKQNKQILQNNGLGNISLEIISAQIVALDTQEVAADTISGNDILPSDLLAITIMSLDNPEFDRLQDKRKSSLRETLKFLFFKDSGKEKIINTIIRYDDILASSC